MPIELLVVPPTVKGAPAPSVTVVHNYTAGLLDYTEEGEEDTSNGETGSWATTIQPDDEVLEPATVTVTTELQAA